MRVRAYLKHEATKQERQVIGIGIEGHIGATAGLEGDLCCCSECAACKPGQSG